MTQFSDETSNNLNASLNIPGKQRNHYSVGGTFHYLEVYLQHLTMAFGAPQLTILRLVMQLYLTISLPFGLH